MKPVVRPIEVVHAACKYGFDEFLDLILTGDFVFNEEPDVGAKRRAPPLCNSRLCAGACEKIPRTFAHSVGLLNKIVITPPVCLCVRALSFIPRMPPKPPISTLAASVEAFLSKLT